MFDSVRKHQRILQFILLVLILPAFVFFGISGYQGMLSADRGVAKVGDIEIFQQEFDAAQRQQIDRMRQMFGDAIDVKLFDTPEARERILESLITQKALAQHAQQSRVIVTDPQVQQAILGIEGLKRSDGSFDKARYEALVSARGMTPAGFESLVRSDLLVQALPDALQSSTLLPRTIVDRLLVLQGERREVRVATFSVAEYGRTVKPAEESLKAYYDAQGARFDTPEITRVEFVVLSRDALAERITLAPDAASERYRSDQARYSVPEQRRAAHILIKPGVDAKARAEKLLTEIRGDAGRFEAAAKAQSEDPGSAAQGGDLGFFERGMMVKPFADAAFEMKEGEIRGPVESEFGWHLIRLVAIKPGSLKPFEAVRSEIEGELRQQQAATQFAEAAQQFTDLVYEQSESLQPAAQRWSLPTQTGQLSGRSPLADKDSVLSNPRLVAALWSDEVLRNKRNTEAIDLGNGRLAAARVLDHQAPQRRPFEAVRGEVTRAVINLEAAKLAREAGEARLAALRADPKESVRGFSELKRVSRSAPEGLPPKVLEAVFKASTATLPAFLGVDEPDQGYFLLELVKVTPPSAEEMAQARGQGASQLERALAQQELSAYLDAVKSGLKIVRHPERIGARNASAP